MKILYDISACGFNKAGCGFYTSIYAKELYKKLNSTIEFSKTFGQSNYHPSLLDSEIVGKKAKIFCTIKYKFLNDKFWGWKNNIFINKFDIIHSNNFWAPTLKFHNKFIYTLYDTSVFDYPEFTTDENRVICSTGIYRSSLVSDHIISISEFSKQKYLEYFPTYDPKKIDVIYPTSRFENYKKNYSKREMIINGKPVKNFFLSVSTIEPRKNYSFFLNSFKEFVKNNHDIDWIIVGKKGWLFEDFFNEIKSNKLENRIHFLGYVDDDKIAELYQNCLAHFFLSKYEGFGMPVLEAMNFDCLQILSDIPTNREIFGDDGVFVNFDNKKLYQLMNDVRDKKIDKNIFNINRKKRLSIFNTESNTNKLLNIYKKVYESNY